MAWIETARGGRWRVCWREHGRTSRNRTFETMPEAEQYRELMAEAWPARRSSEPRSGLPRRAAERTVPMAARIAKYTQIDDNGCWRWQGQINRFGYGQINVHCGSGKRRCVRAHRASYEAHVGPIPDGLEIDHLCRIRDCVNPKHLEPVTRSENIRRAWQARIAQPT